EALEEDAAKREDICAGIDDSISPRLLRCHVAHGADDHPRERHGRQIHEPSEPEIEEFYLVQSASWQKEVTGLEIAVNDVSPMQRAERFRHAGSQGDALGDGERSTGESSRKIFALEPLHDQVALTLQRGAVVDVLDNARVPDLGEHLSFGREA